VRNDPEERSDEGPLCFAPTNRGYVARVLCRGGALPRPQWEQQCCSPTGEEACEQEGERK